jgi:hypothetical protein
MKKQLTERTHVPTDTSRQCQFQRKDRTRCKAYAHKGLPFCFFHDPAFHNQRAAARKAGGIARTRRVVLPAHAPVKSLRTAADIGELLGETINQVRRGEIDLRVSNATGYLSGILLSAIEKGLLEERLAALEAVLTNPDHSNNNFGEHESFDFVQPNPEDPSSPR